MFWMSDLYYFSNTNWLETISCEDRREMDCLKHVPHTFPLSQHYWPTLQAQGAVQRAAASGLQNGQFQFS